MFSSDNTSTIYLTDSLSQIKNKINKYAFSGGQDTAELQRELDGRTRDDVVFQYLTFFWRMMPSTIRASKQDIDGAFSPLPHPPACG